MMHKLSNNQIWKIQRSQMTLQMIICKINFGWQWSDFRGHF